MPNVYTPSAVKLTTVTEPVGGELRNAASVTAMTRKIADGILFERATMAPLLSLTALAAVIAPADNTPAHVLGQGWYVFKTSATTGLFPFRVAAADATPGGWVASAAHQTTITRQAPVPCRVRGITNDGSGNTPAATAPTTPQQTFVPLQNADAMFAMGQFLPLRAFTGATNNYGYLVDIHDALIDGSTLTSAVLLFGAFGHAALPTRQPSFGIVRSLVSGVFGTPSNLLGGSGLVTLAAADHVAYDDAQLLVYVPSQNNVIDKSQYQYSAIIFDEAGTNAGAGGLGFLGCSYQSIQLLMSIPDGRRT